MIAEWILTRFSQEIDLPFGGVSEKEPLKVLQREYPDLAQLVTGKRVLDFGCGQGNQSALLAKLYGAKVTGIDNNPKTLAWAIDTNGGFAKFHLRTDPNDAFDVVISQNSMEHFVDARGVLQQMKRALAPDGTILITFGPPWFAPYGSHMHFFCRIPWLNLLFPEKAVMRVRSRYRQDGAKRYTEVEGGLAEMSLRKFEKLIRASGLTVMRRHYTGVKGLNFLTRIPILRELTTVHVTVLLKHSGK